MNVAHPIVQLIDRQVELNAEREFPFRAHLGGSMIGRQCDREIFYGFRWAKRPAHAGRLLRLFARGHREEFNFVRYLRSIGCEVREYSERLFYHPESDCYFLMPWELAEGATIDPLAEDVTGIEEHHEKAGAKGVRPKQWRILDVDGHFGGSLDGMASNVPGVDESEILLEFKTHNTKSFAKLLEEGVRLTKPEHYKQMQVYMHKRGLKLALYMAVNKNDDHLFVELVPYDEATAVECIEKARSIIYAKDMPQRAGKTESWFTCKFCEYKGICHRGEPMDKNCRTCKHSEPVADGKWRCNKWNMLIPNMDAMLNGCDAHKQITD